MLYFGSDYVKGTHKKILEAILKTNDFQSALQHKLALESEGVSADSDIYYELIYRCYNSKTVLDLKAEIEYTCCKITQRMYLCIYKKIDTVVLEWSVNSKTPQLEKLQIIRKTGKQKDIPCHIVQDDSGFIVVLYEGG